MKNRKPMDGRLRSLLKDIITLGAPLSNDFCEIFVICKDGPKVVKYYWEAKENRTSPEEEAILKILLN